VKLISWNVNGLRAVLRKNFLEFLAQEKPDILCLQETKAGLEDVEQLWPVSYATYWNVALKKGYSGTAIFAKKRPLQISGGIGKPMHDKEGRVLTAEYPEFFVVNVYVPNSKRDLSRLSYRQQWDRHFLQYLKKLELCVGYVEIAAKNYRLPALELFQVLQKVSIPLLPVRQPAQVTFGIRNVNVH